jgi:hypothetical protein
MKTKLTMAAKALLAGGAMLALSACVERQVYAPPSYGYAQPYTYYAPSYSPPVVVHRDYDDGYRHRDADDYRYRDADDYRYRDADDYRYRHHDHDRDDYQRRGDAGHEHHEAIASAEHRTPDRDRDRR